MASKYWIKLYHEILDDPKMGRLDDLTWRRVIELFLMAGELDCDGRLPCTDDIAWRLRCDVVDLHQTLKLLEGLGIITKTGAGWSVTHFAERQAPMSDAERQRRKRERDQKEQYYGHEECHEDVTKPNVDKIREDKIREDTDSIVPATRDVPTVPASFPEWQTYIREYTDSNGKKNYQSALRYMFTTLYPGHDPPEYSYLAKVARKVGGAGRLADLLWQSSTRPPTGDVLAYVQGIARRDKEKVEPAGFQAVRDLAEEEGWTSGDVVGNI